MSELNLIQGDATHALRGIKIACQTFRPTYDHVLEWVDLDLRLGTFMSTMAVLIQYADASHEPWGDYLSRNRYIVDPPWNAMAMNRFRFSMQPFLLTKGEYYAITVRAAISLISPDVLWSYKTAPSSYPGGIRSYSNDGGESWTHCYDEDFVFGEFGTPPAPPPPPEPPIARQIPTDLEQIITATGYKIIYKTNVPCHCFMRWTTVPPQRHIVPVYKRGIYLHGDIRQCFVAYQDNEQIEPGDTVVHTFIKEPWPICEIRWFYFWATIVGEESPSTSPIFKKHRAKGLRYLIFLEPWTEWGVIPPPEMELIFLEPWTEWGVVPPPEMELIFLEPWSEWVSFQLIFLEPWTEWGVVPPPEMELIFLEPWSEWGGPALIFLEPWSE